MFGFIFICGFYVIVWRPAGSGAHPASYPVGIGCSFPGDIAAGAWSWPLSSV